jgi:DNA-binding XRE family transcriptional regulator
MTSEDELIAAADELIARPRDLPEPAERKRLREAHGLTQDDVAKKFRVSRATVIAWEAGRKEPRTPHRRAYAHLLRGLAELYPADSARDDTKEESR